MNRKYLLVFWWTIIGLTIISYAATLTYNVPLQPDQTLNIPSHGKSSSLKTGQSVAQTIDLGHATLDAIAISYIASQVPLDHSVHLTIKQNGQNITTFEQNTTDIAPPLNSNLPPSRWLFFSLKNHPTIQAKQGKITLQLSVSHAPANNPLVIPYEHDATKNPNNEFYINDHLTPGNLGLATFYQPSPIEKLNFTLRDQANLYNLLVIALVGLIGTALIFRPAPLLILSIVALAISLPLYLNLTNWGIHDWTEAASHYSAARQAIFSGQFPAWTPLMCGGAPLWANPQPYWFSLTWLFTVGFGDILGTKLAITAYFFLGAWGMYQLSRTLNLSRTAALVPAVIWIANGFLTSHLGVGQILWLTTAWIPWSIFFYLKSFHNRWLIIYSAIFYLLIFFEGRLHLMVYLTLFFIAYTLLHTAARPRHALKHLRQLSLLALLIILLGAIHILPTWFFLSQVDSSLTKYDGLPISHTLDVLTNRQIGLNQPQPWMQMLPHEYNATIGYPALILAIIGIIFALRRRSRPWLILTIIGALFLALATISGNYNPLAWFPGIKELRNSNRAIGLVVFTLALLAGYGAHQIERILTPRAKAYSLGLLLALIIVFDLHLISLPVFKNLYTQKPQQYESIPAEFYQSTQRTDLGYHNIVAGVGSAAYCPPHLRVWHEGAQIFGRNDDEYQGEVYTANGTKVSLQSITSNSLTIKIADQNITQADTLFINQRYGLGWHATDGRPVLNDQGRLSTQLYPGDANQVITLAYRAPCLISGGTITLATLIGLALLRLRQHHHYLTSSKAQPSEPPQTS